MKKILIVEDDAFIGFLYSRFVKIFEYEMIGIAKTSEEAICLAKENSPDIILMDIKIPGSSDGIETMRKISKFCNAKAIYITAHSEQVLRTRAADTNIAGYFMKPVNMHEVKMLIQNLN